MGDDAELVRRLRDRDEAAFAELVDAYHTRLVRFAGTFVTSRPDAEDVVQDTWVAVIRGVERFEERSSLSTWLFRICANRARSRFGSTNRLVPSSPAVDAGHFDGKGGWLDPPSPWTEIDDRLAAESLAPVILAAIEELPESQRQVVTLRDVEGLSSNETCEVLSITEANQRVLLHRARARVRDAIDAAQGREAR